MNKWKNIRFLGDENRTGHTTGKSKKPFSPVTQGRFAIYNKKVTYTKGSDGRLKIVERNEQSLDV